MRGSSDEKGIEQAYYYLSKAYKLSGDESFHGRMNLLGDELSAYLLGQANRFLAKPSGSGTELGWTYLSEAFSYRASNLSAVREAMTAAEPAHTIRSKLLIRTHILDQTSQEGGSRIRTATGERGHRRLGKLQDSGKGSTGRGSNARSTRMMRLRATF